MSGQPQLLHPHRVLSEGQPAGHPGERRGEAGLGVQDVAGARHNQGDALPAQQSDQDARSPEVLQLPGGQQVRAEDSRLRLALPACARQG